MSSSFSLPTIVQQLTSAISQAETQNGTTGVGASLNNPGGITNSDWESQFGGTPTESGFESFPSLQSGSLALTALVDKYISSGASISSMMNAYAPPASNPTTPARIASMASATGLDPNASIASQTGVGSTSNLNTMLAPLLGALGIMGATGTTAAIVGTGNGTAAPPVFSFGRIAAFVVGSISLIIGLASLKQTQTIVQPIIDAGKDGVKGAVAVAP